MHDKRIAECNYKPPNIKLSNSLFFSTMKNNVNYKYIMCTKEIVNSELLSFDFEMYKIIDGCE